MGADDTHGAPIMLRAEADGIAPEELIRLVGESHQRDYKRFHLSFDIAIAGGDYSDIDSLHLV